MLPEIITAIPGSKSQSLATRLRAHESRNVTFLCDDFPVFWQKASGSNVWDVDGNRYLDFTSAFGVASLGHSPPEVLEALANQSEQLLHGMGDVHPTEQKVAVCEKLSQFTFERWQQEPAKVILGNTGFEAIESALKTALLATGKPEVITFKNAYHGLGYGALSAGGMDRFRSPFRTQLADIGHMVPFPQCSCGHDSHCTPDCLSSLEAIESELRKRIDSSPVGAILVEPVQGRGGKVVPPSGFLPLLRKVCDDSETLLIADEILTGLNRCGDLFACETSQTIPDLICLGKSLASGLPLSACIGSAKLMDQAWPASDGEAIHTTTHLGNPLACAMALASLELHGESGLAARVRQKGDYLRDLLEQIDLPARGRIRGRGLLLGVEILTASGKPDPQVTSGFLPHALKQGLIVLADSPQGNVISLVPPFVISKEEMDYFVSRLQEYLTSLPGSIS